MAEFSFKDVKQVWLAEKTSRELVEIPEEFYRNVARYVAQLNLELKHSESLRGELLQEELRNVFQMIQEIHLSRVFKAVDEIAHGRLPAPLLERERCTFSEIRQSLEKLYTELVSSTMTGRTELAGPREITNILLIVQTEVPPIVGDDLRQYGPFKRGDITSLPRRTAELMLKHGLARKIEVKD
jgi:DNA replication factor GINS